MLSTNFHAALLSKRSMSDKTREGASVGLSLDGILNKVKDRFLAMVNFLKTPEINGDLEACFSRPASKTLLSTKASILALWTFES